jgi:hypothetical protein
VDVVGEAGQDVRVRLGQNPVTQVEDVTWSWPGLRHDPVSAVADHRPGGQADGRVQVALEGLVLTDTPAGLVQRNPPVHPDHIRPGPRHQSEELSGSDAEMNSRHPEISYS